MKRTKTTKIVLIVTVVLEVLFAGSCFVFPDRVPPQLITYWHVGFIAELMTCGGIKVSKVLTAYDREDIYSDDEEDIVG